MKRPLHNDWSHHTSFIQIVIIALEIFKGLSLETKLKKKAFFFGLSFSLNKKVPKLIKYTVDFSFSLRILKKLFSL